MNKDKQLSILHICTYDLGGGAEKIAATLVDSQHKIGHNVSYLVGQKRLSNNLVFEIPRFNNIFTRCFLKVLNIVNERHPVQRYYGICLLIQKFTNLQFLREYICGHERFKVFGTIQGIQNLQKIHNITSPDIIHIHNLHGDYFDLDALEKLSQEIPVVITLHDSWMLTGHCAQFIDCMKWKNGCGNCPNLSIYPSLIRDGTLYNWKKKSEIYSKSKLHIICPSEWLLYCVKESMLMNGVLDVQVIPNGVDLDIFKPGDKYSVRSELGLPNNRFIILFSANGLRKNPFKDYELLNKTLHIISNSGKDVLCLALGDSGDTEFIGESVEIRFIPFISDAMIVAQYYQAVDVYVHPAKADTFPTSVIEAEACGLPVVASAVCGIPEQIIEGETGYLIPSGNAEMMAKRILQLKEDVALRVRMGKSAMRLAKEKYDEKVMVEKYLEYYQNMLNNV